MIIKSDIYLVNLIDIAVSNKWVVVLITLLFMIIGAAADFVLGNEEKYQAIAEVEIISLDVLSNEIPMDKFVQLANQVFLEEDKLISMNLDQAEPILDGSVIMLYVTSSEAEVAVEAANAWAEAFVQSFNKERPISNIFPFQMLYELIIQYSTLEEKRNGREVLLLKLQRFEAEYRKRPLDDFISLIDIIDLLILRDNVLNQSEELINYNNILNLGKTENITASQAIAEMRSLNSLVVDQINFIEEELMIIDSRLKGRVSDFGKNNNTDVNNELDTDYIKILTIYKNVFVLSAEIYEPAELPIEPYRRSPGLIVNMLLGAGIGFLGGLWFVYLKEWLWGA